MEKLSGPIFFLAAYWCVFFWKFLSNPFRMCTSEIASTFFPFWRWSRGRIIFRSDIFYEHPACIPFLSSFYPPQILTSYITRFLKSIDNQFILFSLGILLHFLLGSFLAFHSLLSYGSTVALFGALSLTYSAYFVKPFTPCCIYTHAWVLGALSGGNIGALSLGMAILGGYWPTLVYILPILLVLHPSNLWGLLLGLPQIIPFLWYWPRSIRYKQKFDPKWGKVPLWRYVDLLLPNVTQNSINGVFWPEMAMYAGIIPFIILIHPVKSMWLLGIIASFIITIQRAPARSLYLFSISLIMIAISHAINLPILILQAFLLLENSKVYPHFPFCQWWKRPSEMFKEKVLKPVWPHFTGYIWNEHVRHYAGGFRLRD